MSLSVIGANQNAATFDIKLNNNVPFDNLPQSKTFKYKKVTTIIIVIEIEIKIK